ncbi:MAG: hypothetical protein WC451_06100 [Patescibacteria group bacterium]
MENAVQVYEAMPLTADQIRGQVNLIQEVMKSVMRENEHYGKIPGCGDKPSLLKPGAEKLMFTFRLVADPEVEVFDLYHPTVQGHREYRVKVKISSINGTYMGGGIGSCSTMEAKYRFRGGEKISTNEKVPTEYWNLKKANKFDEAKALIGGDNYGVAKIDGSWMICEIGEKQEHDNPADFYNTCEKMAKKRALVDATLTVTAASDIFTQDIEELVDNGVMTPKPESKPPVQAPQKKEMKDPNEPATEAQLKAINTILGKSGIKDDFEKHEKVSRIIEMPEPKVIESFSLLTKGQASKVIETLMAEQVK